MRFLLLNQTFYPDVMATGQYLSDVAAELAMHGHEVTVVTSRRAYDSPDKIFFKKETWRGVRIVRISGTGFGKGAEWRRALDFGSFMLLCALRALVLPRPDVVLALTSPPLISCLGAVVSKLRGSRFVYWVMDFNPDEAIAGGWLRPGSIAARVLEVLSRFSLRSASRIIALDRFMASRIEAKGIALEKVIVLPPWSQDAEVRFDAAGRERFRKAHGLDGRFVVMYSGNHSPVHPLDTLLEATERLTTKGDIVFAFVGGGSEFRKVQAFAERQSAGGNGGSRFLCLPYQPVNGLAASLSAADLHVVVMGNSFVGLVHPCKVYNILKVGRPVLYIGPQPSPVTEIGSLPPEGGGFFAAGHGEVERVAAMILSARELVNKRPGIPGCRVPEAYSREAILPRLIETLCGNLCGNSR